MPYCHREMKDREFYTRDLQTVKQLLFSSMVDGYFPCKKQLLRFRVTGTVVP